MFPSQRFNFKGSLSLVATVSMPSTSHSILALRKYRCSLLIRIVVAEHCIFALLSFLTATWIRGPVHYVHVLEGIIDFTF